MRRVAKIEMIEIRKRRRASLREKRNQIIIRSIRTKKNESEVDFLYEQN